MKIPRLAHAVGYIDDDLIAAAEEYKPKKAKLPWLRYAAAAACICFVILGVVKVVVDTQENPITNATVYGVLAEVTEVLDDGKYKIQITGEDENFAKGDLVIINSDYAESETEAISLEVGDIIAVTYSSFEKDGATYEITPGQIEVISAD